MFVILLAIVSCASIQAPSHIPSKDDLVKKVYVDKNFTLEQQKDLAYAMYQWECNTDGMVKFTVSYGFDMNNYHFIENAGYALVIEKTDSLDHEIQEMDKLKTASKTIGLYIAGSDTEASRILLVGDRIFYDSLYIATMQHEIGHAQGMGHSSSTNSIMYPLIPNGAWHITDYDLEVLCTIYNCDPTKFKRNCEQ